MPGNCATGCTRLSSAGPARSPAGTGTDRPYPAPRLRLADTRGAGLRRRARRHAARSDELQLSLGHALVFLLAGLGIVAILHTFRNLVLLSIRPGRCEPVFAGSLAQFGLMLENRRPDGRTSLRLFVDDEEPREVDIGPTPARRPHWMFGQQNVAGCPCRASPSRPPGRWAWSAPGAMPFPNSTAGLSGTCGQSAAPALEQRIGARVGKGRPRGGRLFRFAQASGGRCAAPYRMEGRRAPAGWPAADQAVSPERLHNSYGSTGRLCRHDRHRAAPVHSGPLDPRRRRGGTRLGLAAAGGSPCSWQRAGTAKRRPACVGAAQSWRAVTARQPAPSWWLLATALAASLPLASQVPLWLSLAAGAVFSWRAH